MGWHIVSSRAAGEWIAKQISGSYVEGASSVVALVRDNKFVAGVLYEQWNGRSIVAHIAVTGRMTPAFLAAIFDFPFKVCGAHKVICPVPFGNQRSMNLARKMGFQLEAMISDACPTGHVYLFTLTRSECRFIEDRYGKKCTSTPAAA